MKYILILFFITLHVLGYSQVIQNNLIVGKNLLVKNEYKKAYKVLSKANKKFETNYFPEILYYEGIACFNKNIYKNNEESIKLFSDYIDKKPLDAKGYLRRGIVYLNSGRNNLAINDFNRCISLNPSIADAYYYKAFALSDKSQISFNEYDSSDSIFYKIDENYTKFLSLVDSTNDLFKYAHFHRGIFRQFILPEKANEDLKYLHSPIGLLIYTSPQGIRNFDTAQYYKIEEKSLLEVSGFLISNDNSYNIDTISIQNLLDIKNLSELLSIDSIKSFRLTLYRKHEKEGLSSEWIETFNNGNNFSPEIYKILKSLRIDDIIYFEDIIVIDKNGIEQHYSVKKFKGQMINITPTQPNN